MKLNKQLQSLILNCLISIILPSSASAAVYYQSVTMTEGETKTLNAWALSDSQYDVGEKAWKDATSNIVVLSTSDYSATILALSPGTAQIRHNRAYYNNGKNYDNIYYTITINKSSYPKIQLTPSTQSNRVLKGTVLTLTPSVSGSTIYYSTSSSVTPGKSSTFPSSGITLNSTITVRAQAVKSGYPLSDVFEHTYTVIPNSDFQVKVAGGATLHFKILNESAKTCQLYFVPDTEMGELTIPEQVNGYTVKEIGSQACLDCSKLTKIILPSTISIIGTEAFKGCTGLKSINIPEGVTSISSNAFNGCNSLTSIDLPKALTSIKSSAFENCTTLPSVIIPKTVTSIASNAFAGCPNLKSITSYIHSPFAIDDNVFTTYNASVSLNVPLGSATKYRSTSGWMQFININEVPDPDITYVTGIILNETEIELFEDDGKMLKETVTPTNATDKTVTWTTSNNQVATVSTNGLVVGVKDGSATITCTANDNSGVKATCTVTVKKKPVSVSQIILNKTALTLEKFKEYQLTATVKPDNATNKGVTWTTDNAQVADVTNTGLITALAEGTATITCTANDGSGVSANCVVTVSSTPGPIPGDVNGDRSVNGTDLVALTNIVLGKTAKTASADVNGDGSVNGTDYVALVNIILGKSNSRMMTPTASASEAYLSIGDFDIKAGETKEMLIDLTNPNSDITLVQFDLRLPDGLAITMEEGEYAIGIAGRTTWKKHSLDANTTDGIIRFLLSSTKNAVLEGSSGAIISVKLTASSSFTDGIIRLENILLVTPDEKEVKPADIERHVGNVTPVTDLQEGAFYVRNVAKHLYITNGGNWGTHIAVDSRGLDLSLQKSNDEKHWNILSGFTATGALGTEGYVDNNQGTDLTITKQANGTYTIVADNGRLLTVNDNDHLANFEGVSATDAKAQWEFVSTEDVLAERFASLSGASASNPVDATFLVKNANINNARDQRFSAWSINTGNANWNRGIYDMDAEPILEFFRPSWNECSNGVSLSQSVRLIPGRYKLEAQGFYRDGDYTDAAGRRILGEEKLDAYLFAGGNQTRLKSIFDDATTAYDKGFSTSTSQGYVPNTMTEASYTFQKGVYNNELDFSVNEEGSVEIGIRVDESFHYNNWTTIDNFRLTYYGQSEIPSPVTTSAYLDVEDFCIAAGKTAEMIIDLNNPEDEITLVQFDLRLPSGLSVAMSDGEYAIDIDDVAGRTTWKKHSLDANATEGIIRVLLSSTKNAVLQGSSGAIIKVSFVADNSYQMAPICFENILLVTPNEKEIKPGNMEYVPGYCSDIKNTIVDDVNGVNVYNLSGQRLSAPRKGINIIGRKKVVIK